MINQRLLLVASIGFLLSYFSAIYSYAEALATPLVTVKQIASCSKSVTYNDAKSIKAVYREGNDLVVSVRANASCGGLKAESPQVVFKGKSADLSWVWNNPDNGPLTACLCAHKLEFRVAGAPNEVISATAEARQEQQK